MIMNDMRFEMMKTLKGRQDKFIYYVSGLNVASIGFILSKTFERIPNRTHDLILAFTLLCWIMSLAISFRWIYLQFRTMETNLDLNDLDSGFYDKSLFTEAQARALMSTYKSRLSNDATKCSRSINLLILFFISGMISFVLWRVLDAYQII